jgi:hypothetical protein
MVRTSFACDPDGVHIQILVGQLEDEAPSPQLVHILSLLLYV